jgi:glycosyltransferase involved in cell wall biosynthesis
MTRSIHLVSYVAPGLEGGLEMWTLRFAQRAAKAGTRIIVYVCGDQPCSPEFLEGFELVQLAPLRAVWEAPIDVPVWTERNAQEQARLNFLILRNEICRRLGGGGNLLVSNFAVTAGYLTALVGRDLGLPHIAMFVGTDFSRGFRNARERPALDYVCRTAAAVVVKNTEQERALKNELGLRSIVRIPTSIEMPPPVARQRKPDEQVTLMSDCGFTFKKGTGVLMDSFERLVGEGLPVRLVIYGGIAADQAAYWKQRLVALGQTASARLHRRGHVDRQTIYEAFRTTDIFCSATLGEGSSSGRIAAVCAGLPIVTTRCGEMESELDGVSHVRLSNVADADGFLAALRAGVNDVMSGTLPIDAGAVQRWRDQFAPAREADAWAALMNEVAAR